MIKIPSAFAWLRACVRVHTQASEQLRLFFVHGALYTGTVTTGPAREEWPRYAIKHKSPVSRPFPLYVRFIDLPEEQRPRHASRISTTIPHIQEMYLVQGHPGETTSSSSSPLSPSYRTCRRDGEEKHQHYDSLCGPTKVLSSRWSPVTSLITSDALHTQPTTAATQTMPRIPVINYSSNVRQA